jgi:hypothetical protein
LLDTIRTNKLGTGGEDSYGDIRISSFENKFETEKLFIPNKGNIDIVHFSIYLSGNGREVAGYQNKLHVYIDIQLTLKDYLKNRDKFVVTPTDDRLLKIDNMDSLLDICYGYKYKITTDGPGVNMSINIVGDNYTIYYTSPDFIETKSMAIYKNFRTSSENGDKTNLSINLKTDTKDGFVESFIKFVDEYKMTILDKVGIKSLAMTNVREGIDKNLVGNNPPFEIEHYRKAIRTLSWAQYTFKSQNFDLEFLIMIDPAHTKEMQDNAKIKKQVVKNNVGGDSYYMTKKEFTELLKTAEFLFSIDNKEKSVFIEYTTPEYQQLDDLADNYSRGIAKYITQGLETINTALEYEMPYKFEENYMGSKWSY